MFLAHTVPHHNSLRLHLLARVRVRVPTSPPTQPQVLVELDRRLRDFQQNTLRNGALSYSTATFAEEFGEEVAQFYATAAANPGHGALLDRVLAGESNLRKDFPETPRGADLVVMGVVSYEGVQMF